MDLKGIEMGQIFFDSPRTGKDGEAPLVLFSLLTLLTK